MDYNKFYANCLNKMRRKLINLDDLRPHLNQTRRFNQVKARNNTNSNTNQQTKNK